MNLINNIWWVEIVSEVKLMAKFDDKKQLKCSFCGKNQDQVKRLIAGPGVYICDECIELCSEIISDETEDTLEFENRTLSKPQDIK